VPWCDECDKLVEDDELTEEGSCPQCGDLLTGRRPIPWQFRLMIGATVIYLGYRAYQLVSWIVRKV
jgi:DNA-directed RNA polymerase subunit RPC12/RpoP